MRALLSVSFVLFGLVLLTTALRVIWPSVLLFTLSLVFLANHMALAHGAFWRFRIWKNSSGSIPSDCSKNVALSYLGLFFVLLSLFAQPIGESDSDDLLLNPGDGIFDEEIASIGQDGGDLAGEDILGAEGGGEGDGLGAGRGEGNATGDGDDAEGFEDGIDGEEAEDSPSEPVEMATVEEVPEEPVGGFELKSHQLQVFENILKM